MTFFQFLEKFPTEQKVIDYFIQVRYGATLFCNHCGSPSKVYNRKKPKFFDCKECNNTFSIFKDTIFEKSRTDLRKWMYAIHLFLNSKKGISGLQLKREIGVTYKTAWRMLKQIRTAMGNKNNEEFKRTVIEIDETYVGGKPRKSNDKNNDDKPKRGRGTKKTPVVGVVDRNNKKIHAKVALPNKEGKKLTGKQLLSIIDEVVKEDSILMTDEFRGYRMLRTTQHLHFVIDHSKGYTNGDIHTNNIEGFWSVLKRGILGIYHHVSTKYLQDYINEFCFRYNNRKEENIFDLVLQQAVIG